MTWTLPEVDLLTTRHVAPPTPLLVTISTFHLLGQHLIHFVVDDLDTDVEDTMPPLASSTLGPTRTTTPHNKETQDEYNTT